MRIAVLSDTHAPRRWKSCPPAVAAYLRESEIILHAGDVCTVEVLDELSTWAPVHAVRGNNDGADIAAWGAPAQLRLNLGGVDIGMIHDSGAAGGRGARLRRLFPDVALVVFGHSHIPMDEVHRGTGSDLRIFNPGSPTDRRRQPHGTMGLLDIHDGQLTASRIVAVT